MSEGRKKEPEMRAIKSLVVAAVAAMGLAAVPDVQAAGGHAWSGARPIGGTWSGRGHWGGYRSHWYGPRFGLYIGAPLLWSAWYWGGYPYGYPYGYYYPRTVIYPDYPAYPEGVMEPAPSTEISPRLEGAPRQGPLYMNYCESARAYFPKVTSCPEGWRFVEPAR
jgi:hypothetical protein